MPVSKDELQTPEVKALIEEYDNRVQSKIGDDRPDDDVILMYLLMTMRMMTR
jgi:hypothetical protein